MALVSIVVPVYNRPQKIKRLIRTVKNQTLKDWELLVVDDGSDDNTYDIIVEEAASDSRILPFKNHHTKGPSGARNTGIENSSGKYIAYQDSDDEWIPSHLEKMVSYLEKYPEQIDIMTANALRKTEQNGEIFSRDELDLTHIQMGKIGEAYLLNKDLIFDRQLRDHVLTTQCIVGKSTILKVIKWNEELRAAEDNLYNLEICALRPKISHIQDFHTVYWIHNDNITNANLQHSSLRMEPIHKSFVKYLTIILKTFPLTRDQARYIRYNLSRTLAWHLGYHTYESQNLHMKALSYYAKAIRVCPWSFIIYKSAFKSLIKNFTHLILKKRS